MEKSSIFMYRDFFTMFIDNNLRKVDQSVRDVSCLRKSSTDNLKNIIYSYSVDNKIFITALIIFNT